ncbi:PaaX family transcriptional regulator C-terminal domain-containing protein [Actinoplanes sp. NPDC049548]|uniref:PaaX family transcriptional regulator C-terminal domain-containing protein n=1 Tax=Actinoplanes sp. NPDC049548 TaxID=3155152 RepID=UPI00344353C3
MPFLFGVTGADELAGVVLVRLLGDLGVGAAAARAQLARMRIDGQLAASHRGRQAHYRLAGPFAASFRHVRDASGGGAPRWDGHFHALLYQVPEAQRAYRDRLRRMAQLVGYGLMQQGVLIAVRDLTGELGAVIAECPAGCRVQAATIALPAADAAEVARAAWDLEAVAATFRGHIGTLSAALAAEGSPPPTAATLARFAEVLNAVYVDLIRDPRLPAALLPPDWPRPELDRLMGRVRERFLPAASRYARSVMAEAE